MLPKRIPKRGNRSNRWKSQAHCNFVRSHACSVCGSTAAIEVAHVRLGTDGGMGRKPSDYWTVSLCRECHVHQHTDGEGTFWATAKIDPKTLAMEFAKASPRWAEIRRHIAENV